MTARATIAALAAMLSSCGKLAPAHADAWIPGRQSRDPGRTAAAVISAPVAQPAAASRVDATGQRYSAQDVALGFLPVPRGYQRFGGGIARAWGGAPISWKTPGLDTPATVTVALRLRVVSLAPDPLLSGSIVPKPSPQPDPKPSPKPQPDPKPVPAVPGPLGLAGAAAAFAYSRRLRRRIR